MMEYFRFFPQEIKLDILSRVPTESILECKLVSKTWKNLILHPSFSKMHFHQSKNYSADDDCGKLGFLAWTYVQNFYYIEFTMNHDESTNPIERIRKLNLTSPFNDTVFAGSCNGLICLTGGRSCIICNPITREHTILPEIEKNGFWVNGFGYVSSTNQYKVVGMCRLNTENVEVHIYTLGSGSGWRNLGIVINFESRKKGIFANGAIYWLDKTLERIHSFDLAEEKFSENLSPPPLPEFSNWQLDYNLGILDGCLSFSSYVVVEGDRFKDVWLLRKMNDRHNQSSCWSREFRLGDSVLSAITKSTKGDGGVLTYGGLYLNIYNTKTSTSKKLLRFKNWVFQVYPHNTTLVSLKELGEEDTKTMESLEIMETMKSHEDADHGYHMYF